jgi:hypothetical protein
VRGARLGFDIANMLFLHRLRNILEQISFDIHGKHLAPTSNGSRKEDGETTSSRTAESTSLFE